ncbi:hypothetical protein C2845_PM13G10260 [Panicum miliaceum]|uniref:Uncharacterized protein n=1 Tax=Panicum miliaceum TaxID=4540 RepID=A0A3L6RG92_PANMI|nr:hypothetical protein C2845_PM13G10260 [Panicum miliaceum]
MAKNRGLRSSSDAKPWVCRCGVRNKPTKHQFFDLPAFSCHGCNKKFIGDFIFCLGEIKVNGQSLVGEVLDQGLPNKCVPFTYSKAAEMTEHMFNAWNGKDPYSAESFNPEDLHQRFEQKFP